MYRNATVQDAKKMNEINIACLPENYDLHEWLTVLQYFSKFCFVAEVNNEIVGYILGIMQDAKHGNIASLAVSKNFRGRGIGKTLLVKSLVELKKSKLSVTLHCRANSNPIAKTLYEKFGFIVKETLKNYYDTEDGYLMENKCNSTKFR